MEIISVSVNVILAVLGVTLSVPITQKRKVRPGEETAAQRQG